MVSFVCCGKYNISMTVLEPGEYDPSSNNFLDLAGDVLEQVLDGSNNIAEKLEDLIDSAADVVED